MSVEQNVAVAWVFPVGAYCASKEESKSCSKCIMRWTGFCGVLFAEVRVTLSLESELTPCR